MKRRRECIMSSERTHLSIPRICAQLHSLVKYLGIRPGSMDFMKARLDLMPEASPSAAAARAEGGGGGETLLLGVEAADTAGVFAPLSEGKAPERSVGGGAVSHSEKICTVPLSLQQTARMENKSINKTDGRRYTAYLIVDACVTHLELAR